MVLFVATFTIIVSSLLPGAPASSDPIHIWIYNLYKQMPFVFSVSVMSVLHTVWIAAMLATQLGNIITNLTTNERLNYLEPRYKYLRNDDGKISNPFDLGFKQNCAEVFFTPTVDHYNLHTLPNAKI